MAILTSNEISLAIIPRYHYYQAGNYEIDEYYYDILIYKNGQKQQYPLGKDHRLINTFEVEISDGSIAKSCLNALYQSKINLISDVFNGGFDMTFVPDKTKWRIEIVLNPYYLEHSDGLELVFDLTYDELLTFGQLLRQEEKNISDGQKRAL